MKIQITFFSNARELSVRNGWSLRNVLKGKVQDDFSEEL